MLKDIQIGDGVIYETWDDGTVYPSPIEAYSTEEAGKVKKFILDRVLDTNNRPSFEEKDRLFGCLRVMNEIIEKEINDSAINSI